MKKVLLTSAALAAVSITALVIINEPENERPTVRTPAPVAQLREKSAEQAPPSFSPPARETVTTPPPPPPAPDPREQWLATLYDSPSVADRLAAARQLAARNDEASMTDLAMFIAAAEETGDDTVLPLAEKVASILGQMRGPGVQALATELAYSASPLVARAAVDAAVASEPAAAPQQFGVAVLPNPVEQRQLEEAIQRLHESETNPPQKQEK